MSDPFDNLMNKSCVILEKRRYGQGSDDAYGQASQQLVTVIAAWPCRISTKGGGNEYKVGKEFSKNAFEIFMRPPLEDDSGTPFQLSPHNWLIVDGIKYNIQGVNDPSMLGHHLEVSVEQIIP